MLFNSSLFLTGGNMAIDLGLGTIIKIATLAVKSIVSIFPVVWNFVKRPSIHVGVSWKVIEFEGNEKKYFPHFTSVNIKNISKSDLVFDLDAVTIGNNSISYVIQQNTYFSRTHPNTRSDLALTTKDEVLNIFRENWVGSKLLTLKPHYSLCIPLFPQKMDSNMYFNVSNNAKFYFRERKIQLSLKIDSVSYDYSLDRMKMLRLIVDDLISNTSFSHERLQ
jgi:hypothetical protein